MKVLLLLVAVALVSADFEDLDDGSGGPVHKSCRQKYYICKAQANGIFEKIKCGFKFTKCVLDFHGDEEDMIFDEPEDLPSDESPEIVFDTVEETDIEDEPELEDGSGGPEPTKPPRKSCLRNYRKCRREATSLGDHIKCAKEFGNCLFKKVTDKFTGQGDEELDDDVMEDEEDLQMPKPTGHPKRKCIRRFEKCYKKADSMKDKFACTDKLARCSYNKEKKP